MGLYFSFKFWYGIAATLMAAIFIVVLFIIVLVIKICFSAAKEKRIKAYLESIGFEYYLRNVESCGNKTWYAFRRDNINVDEDEVYKMSLKDVKEKYK